MEPDGTLEPASLVDLSLRRLHAEILSGVLPPGERLIEEQLTQRFGISRAPLREALRQLAQQGLIEHLPRRGVRVAELSAADADELLALRELLERHAVEVALSQPVPGDLTALTDAWQAMAAAASEGDGFSANEAHQRFHVEVVALAGQRHLLQAFEPVILKLQLLMAANLRLAAENQDIRDGIERHKRLLDAIAAGDPAAALDALASHSTRASYIS
jgi:DNA-binding GntR family transcriptional regulator